MLQYPESQRLDKKVIALTSVIVLVERKMAYLTQAVCFLVNLNKFLNQYLFWGVLRKKGDKGKVYKR